ncbi:MAG: hypothetical protein CV088_10480 [Nitrospira sp. LK70]|nr:hypothetical protein [Nitrospira sp. LK70]
MDSADNLVVSFEAENKGTFSLFDLQSACSPSISQAALLGKAERPFKSFPLVWPEVDMRLS